MMSSRAPVGVDNDRWPVTLWSVLTGDLSVPIKTSRASTVSRDVNSIYVLVKHPPNRHFVGRTRMSVVCVRRSWGRGLMLRVGVTSRDWHGLRYQSG